MYRVLDDLLVESEIELHSIVFSDIKHLNDLHNTSFDCLPFTTDDALWVKNSYPLWRHST
jgi:hypothetical protein